jgi:hypothetical protein
MSPEETNDTATSGAAPSVDSSDSSHGTKAQPVKFPTVIACDHKLDPRHFPAHANCQDCWDAFFEYNTGALASIHQLLLTGGGTQAIVAIHGKKFAAAFGRYLQQQLLKMHMDSQPQIAPRLEVKSLVEL